MAFCETWLDSTRPDDDIILDGFTVYHSDRTKESGKTRGGGLCIYINNRWFSKVKLHTTLCSPNLELLTLSVRPFYLPREFSNIVLRCVYVPPSADALAAADTIACYMQSMLMVKKEKEKEEKEDEVKNKKMAKKKKQILKVASTLWLFCFVYFTL